MCQGFSHFLDFLHHVVLAKEPPAAQSFKEYYSFSMMSGVYVKDIIDTLCFF